MSRWRHWSSGTEERKSFSSFLKEGNPTGTGLQSPGDKARAMGLQSDGRGGYRDPKSGQLVARTVNNELAFYDPGPSGGIVADGNGGAYVTQAQPSWRDPRTGMAMTPPSRPESKQEIAAVPYPTPARPPMGFNKFMQMKQDKAYDPMNPEPMRKNPEEEQQGEAEAAVEEEPEAGLGEEWSADNPMPAAMQQQKQRSQKARIDATKPVTNKVKSAVPNVAAFVDKHTDIPGTPGKSGAADRPDDGAPAPPGAGGAANDPRLDYAATLSPAERKKFLARMGNAAEPELDEDDPRGSQISDLISKVQSGEGLSDDEQQALVEIRRKRRAERSASDGRLTNASIGDVSKILKSLPEKKESAEEKKPIERTPDKLNEDGQLVGRRADHLFESAGITEEELPGESASLQALHMLLNNPKYQDVLDHLTTKPGSAAFKKLPEEIQKTVSEYYQQINDVLPTRFMQSGSWDTSSAKTAKLIYDQLKENYPDGIPKFMMGKPYEKRGMEHAMRLTNIPQEDWDTSYDDAYNRLTEYIGGEEQIRKAIDISKGSDARDGYDATDISLMREGAGQQMMDDLEQKLEELGFDASDGLTDDEIKTALTAFNDIKQKYINDNDLKPISLKQVTGSGPGKFYAKPTPDDMPEVTLNRDNFNPINFNVGRRRVAPEQGGRKVDSFDFDRNSLNIPLRFGDTARDFTTQPRPGNSDKKTGAPAVMAHNPFGTLGSFKSEIRGDFGTMGAHTWLNETLNNYIPGGFDELEKFPQAGVQDGRLRAFSDDDRSQFIDMIQQISDHKGEYGYTPSFNFNGEELDAGGYFDKLREIDDIIDQGKDPTADFGEDEFDGDDYTHRDKLRSGISRAARDQLMEKLGGMPLSQFRQKMRFKLGEAKMLRLFQMLEKAGPEAQRRFFRDKIYTPGKKIQEGGAPGFILGTK